MAMQNWDMGAQRAVGMGLQEARQAASSEALNSSKRIADQRPLDIYVDSVTTELQIQDNLLETLYDRLAPVMVQIPTLTSTGGPEPEVSNVPIQAALQIIARKIDARNNRIRYILDNLGV